MTNDEIVCTCMSVSVKDIRNAIEQGAKDFAQIQKITGQEAYVVYAQMMQSPLFPYY